MFGFTSEVPLVPPGWGLHELCPSELRRGAYKITGARPRITFRLQRNQALFSFGFSRCGSVPMTVTTVLRIRRSLRHAHVHVVAVELFFGQGFVHAPERRDLVGRAAAPKRRLQKFREIGATLQSLQVEEPGL
jgi:hypothetical protein